MVSMITGMSASSGSALSADSTAQPSMPGIITSSVMASGRSSRASRSPSSPPRRGDDRKPSLREEALHQVAHRRVVVDHQHGADARRHAARPGARATGSSTVAATSAGSRTVKVVPWPGSLSTVTSPPIIRQKRRLIARPRPVPPYLRVVDASAWVNASNSRAELLRGHADAGVAHA